MAYDFFLQARRHLRQFEHYDKAQAPLLRALELDPMLAEAYAMLTHVEMGKYWKDYDNSHIDKAYRYARQSLSVNANQSEGHNAMSLVCAFQNRMDLALLHIDHALALNPNSTFAAVNRAQWLAFSGKCAEAVVELELIVKRDPIPPSWYWDSMGSVLFQLRRYQEAIDAYNMADERQPWQIAYTAASLVYLERLEEAQHQTRTLLAEHPTMTISKVLKNDPWQTEEARNHLITGLRKAGLPE